jgi:uncharacterized protein
VLLNIFIIGAAGGILAGMLGVGGAVVMLPLLVAFGGLTLKEASNITIVQVVAASLVSISIYSRARLLHRPLAIRMGIASLVGGLAGGFGSQAMPSFALEWLFLVVVLVALALLFVPVRETTVGGVEFPPFNHAQAYGLGGAVGALAGVLGAGGGFLIVPLIIGALRMPTRLAIGSSPMVVLISALAGLTGKLLAGQIQLAPAAALVAGALPATYVGTQIGRRVSPRFLRILLGTVLACIAVRGVLALFHLA